jgi:hypothetical protein
MKRTWFGLFLLAVLLASGIFVTAGMYRICTPICRQLEQAARTTENAQELCTAAHSRWQQYHDLTASITDHEPMEEVEQLLSRLRLFQKARLGVDFADTCQLLQQLCKAIDESHSLHWWSLL